MKRYLRKVVFCTAKNIYGVISGEEGILYLTDDEVCLKTLKEKNKPVAVWLHENNRNQNLSAASYAVENPRELDMGFYEKVYRREMCISWDILETERCLIREMRPEDAASFAKMYEEPAVSRYLKDFHGSAEGEEQYIREYQQHYRFFEYGVWSVVLKETEEVIGRAGFSEVEEGPRAAGSGAEAVLPCLGYMIGVPWQEKGLAYEVCRAILDYAKEELGFETVQLLVEENNKASRGLAEKLGFVDGGEVGSVSGAGEPHANERGDSCQVLRKVLSLK